MPTISTPSTELAAWFDKTVQLERTDAAGNVRKLELLAVRPDSLNLRSLPSVCPAVGAPVGMGNRPPTQLRRMAAWMDDKLLPFWNAEAGASGSWLESTSYLSMCSAAPTRQFDESVLLQVMLARFCFYRKARTPDRLTISKIQAVLNPILLSCGFGYYLPTGFSSSFLRKELAAWGFEHSDMYYPTLNFRPIPNVQV